MAATTTYCVIVMAASMICIVGSYVGISLKEKTWINWYTFPALNLLAQNYVLPVIYLLFAKSSGSYFAFAYCYLTYACSSLSLMVAYRLAKSRYARSLIGSTSFAATPTIGDSDFASLPWILLALSVLLYLPIIVRFHDFLLTPREIYVRTRTGYGLNFFGSALTMYLAFVTYLFKKRKNIVGGLLLCSTCLAIIYLHGAKGEILGFIEIFVLYRVYVLRRSVRITAAIGYIAAIALAGSMIFAFFGGVTDIRELAIYMSSYSDYTRNAMVVIDDPKGKVYWGRLTLEDEVYSRVPRLIMPSKPKDFGGFRLASIYYPEWFQGDTGSPAFGLGVQYADFGVFAIVFICLWSLLYGWMVAFLVSLLRSRKDPGRFVLLLFFAGAGILPLGDGFLLPETVTLGLLLTFAYRHKFVLRMNPAAPKALSMVHGTVRTQGEI